MRTLPRLTSGMTITQIATAKPVPRFMRYWETLASAIEAAAAVLAGNSPVASMTVAQLPSPPSQAGLIAYASDGRKNGEGAGLGTGVLVFSDATAWRACDTGATVAA